MPRVAQSVVLEKRLLWILREGGIYMNKQIMQFAVVTNNGVVQEIGRSGILQPQIKFGGGSIKWADESKYMKSERKVKKVVDDEK